jgi:acetyl-CoA synthetase
MNDGERAILFAFNCPANTMLTNTESLHNFRAARDVLTAHRTDYAAARARFAWPRIGQFNWALDHFDAFAHSNQNPALWIVADDGSEHIRSFEQMRVRSNQAANWLESLSLKRGDHVLLMLGNEVPLWELMLACIKAGLVIIPATNLLSRDDLIDRLERGRVRLVVTGSAYTAKFDGLDRYAPAGLLRVTVGDAGTSSAPWIAYAGVDAASPHYSAKQATQPDELLLLYFTSGTTSKPKLVAHSHSSYPVGHLSTLYWIGLQEGDVHWNISSPGWGKHAWSCFFAPWIAGACVFIFNYARFEAKRVLDVLVNKRVNALCAPPTVWRMLIQEDLAKYPVKLRECLSAGEPLNPEVIEQVRSAWGITIRDGFGQTETTALVGNPPGQAFKFGSMGRPLPGYTVVLLDTDGKPADEGEVCLELNPRPTGLMLGYAGDDEKTAHVTRDGYYHTGDVAQRDAQGYITYVGRADDVFKASDYRISPFELESVLIEHPAVAEAAVVPSPDPLKLAVPKAFVILAPGHAPTAETARSILAHCREKLAPYKRIRRLEFAELPKTISGKIRRVELRAKEQQRALPVVKGAQEYFDDELRWQ